MDINMEAFKETINLPREFPFEISRGHGKSSVVPILHWHDCLELNYVLSGQGTNIIGDTEYRLKKGQAYVINQNERHYAFSEGALELLVISFDPLFIWANNSFDYDYLKPILEKKINFYNCIEPGSSLAEGIGGLMLEIEKEYLGKESGYHLIIKALLMKILALLYRNFKNEGKISIALNENQRRFERIKEAVAYINEKYTSDINLNMVAQLAFMNPTYFSSYFKRVMKINTTEYILSLRINHAARLLKQTNKSVIEICDESGFSSISYFNKTFKKITKFCPTDYRNHEMGI